MPSRTKLNKEMKREIMKNIRPLTVAAIAAAVTFATCTARAQLGFNQPLTLAQARENAGTEKDAASTDTQTAQELPEGLLSGASVPEVAASEDDVDAIARKLSNPNNSLASLTFKNQLRWYDGDLPGANDQFNYTMVFQPVFPFTMPERANGGKANLFVRPGIPILVNQPVFDTTTGTFDYASGLGDIGFDIGS